MVRRNVERIEIVVFRLHFGPEHDREAALLEVRAGVFERAPQRMCRAHARWNAGERDVDARGKLRREARIPQRGGLRFELRFEGYDAVVDRLAGARTVGRRKAADASA